MMARAGYLVALLLSLVLVHGFPYDPTQVDYNLNQNQTATDAVNYWGEWEGHKYNPSPSNWRFPYYTLFLDRFVNGDPSNDDANGTQFEHDPMQTQLRHGGDLRGLVDTLDYIQGMGVKAIYLAGSPFINLPWQADGYSPVDFTLLDHHFGKIQDWRDAITEIHRRNMYVVIDNTLATMSDLIGFDGYMNSTTPFDPEEHVALWKNDRHYADFGFTNKYNDTCEYPRLYNETGLPVGTDVTSQLVGCYDSDFDQYGDIEAFGVHPDWQRELAKFASVQDRLREWVPSVRARIQQHSCITIAMLDIDAFRLDKATQSTVDAQGAFSNFIRGCAAQFGKKNFMVVGEITGGNTFGSIYVGRGRLSDQNTWPANFTQAVTMNNDTDDKYFIRDQGQQALDAAAFHYSIYRSLTRFLGMDGNLEAGFDLPRNWVDAWNSMLLTNDFVNPNPGGPGGFDPRHLYGVTNQDVFRWPGIANGTRRQLLGHFITTLHMPGSPLILWGEEQAFYALDNTAENYIFGRQSMSSAQAWQYHGCYQAGSAQYYNWPDVVDKASNGCHDDWNSLDHRDPTAPVRNVLKTMFQMRDNYPVLNDGWFLQQLSNMTRQEALAGSSGVTTEFGLWSVLRSRFPGLQDLSDEGGHGNQSVWLVYHNENKTTTFSFDCSNNDTMLNTTALIAPFDAGTTVKNLFYPFDEQTLVDSARSLGVEGSAKRNGCLRKLTMPSWGFAAYVPKAEWQGPGPMVTGFVPGHDARILADFPAGGNGSVKVELHFSMEMDCDGITKSMVFNSSTGDGSTPSLSQGSVSCGNLTNADPNDLVGGVPSIWGWSATLEGVAAGVHRLSISNVSAASGSNVTTGSTDNFMFRIGLADNPVVFPSNASYATNILHAQTRDGSFYIEPNAPGADMVRYSFDWGTTYSNWAPYTSDRFGLKKGSWSGTAAQAWAGDHVILQYWSRLAGSSDHIQHADSDPAQAPRRFPHLYWQGPYNQFGFDAGLDNNIKLDPNDNLWKINFLSEWPDYAQINIWGMNPDGQPDATGVFGDEDQDSVLDRSLPNSLAQTSINITEGPPSPFLAWQFQLDDSTYKFHLDPAGSRWNQLVLYLLLGLVPLMTAGLAVFLFIQSFYRIKFNKVGLADKKAVLAGFIKKILRRKPKDTDGEGERELTNVQLSDLFIDSSMPAPPKTTGATVVRAQAKRRKVLIATMEYDIEDWGAKVKIGGLGVMAQLMGKNLAHQDLIWVVPKVGDIDYKQGDPAEPMIVTVFGDEFEIMIETHQLRNITYVLLDAPIFRNQLKAEPYPPRMDDLESGVYYSAWNQAIAQAIERFKPDLYHINDYHGAVAPLHLLKKGQTIPVCLSLHNAEFQGLWPMRTQAETDEVCSVFNLPKPVVMKYVQFGEVFNLLHAGASYLRLHQQGFGAVGVSKKYGKRSYARYPIFWGLSEIGQLPNPDPSDTEKWDGKLASADVTVDAAFEGGRAELKRQAQEWAGLTQDPDAELMVFVGRWSMQKGVDLIADVFPFILERFPKVQLVCIGPVIDLYGRFAALKLARMMSLYPGRVFSKPEFTALPPYIFSGAEFALIPSRDEPFGLVAVEFGRKGALGIGARVGGLGQMPGWWYTVESTTTAHLLHQFRGAILEALSSKQEMRAVMRARSAKQRFPVVQWVEGLELLQATSIKLHKRVGAKRRNEWMGNIQAWRKSGPNSGANTPRHRSHLSLVHTNHNSRNSRASSIMGRSRGNSPSWRDSQTAGRSNQTSERSQSLDRKRSSREKLQNRGRSWRLSVGVGAFSMSLGIQTGPGHEDVEPRRGRSRRASPVPASPRIRSRSTSTLGAERLHDLRSHEDVPPIPRLSLGLPHAQNERASVSVDGFDDDQTSIYSPGRPHEVTIQRQQAEQALMEQQEHIDLDLSGIQDLRLAPWLRDADNSPRSSVYATPRARSPARGMMTEPGTANTSPRGSVLEFSEPNPDAITPAPFSPGGLIPHPSNWPLPSPLSPSTPRIPEGTEATDMAAGINPPIRDLNREFNKSGRDLSMLAVVGDRTDYHLQKVDPFFTDSTGEYYGAFKNRLRDLNGKNSEGPMCIEEYLVKVEKLWFRRFKDAKLGLKAQGSRPPTYYGNNAPRSHAPSEAGDTMVTMTAADSQADMWEKQDHDDAFDFGNDYKPPSGLKKFMLRRIGDWPIYAFFLAFGQIIAANSYQITLLTGTVGESAERLYIIASVYLVTSAIWWGFFRWFKCVYVLSLPFFFYGLAFLFIGLAYFVPTVTGRGTMQTLGTVWYATASSSGSIFFATNFADEGGAPIHAWLYRACVIQGTQQAYVIALWYWGAELTKETATGLASNSNYSITTVADSWVLTAVTVPIAVGMWVVGLILFNGLPAYYRQAPGAVPSFYSSIFRRRIILWFFVAVALQNYWLSAPYGRNWAFLWSSRAAPAWSIGLLIILFFGVVWAACLFAFGRLSKDHSWILPLFAIGLGAPRWAQMLWSTSGIGLYLPWAGGPVASALVSRTLWLWLGVLDSLQGVGIGMILLQTLTRIHIAFTLLAAQVLGSVFTILARATAPDNIGPGPVFPNFAVDVRGGLMSYWFWIALVCQAVICFGFFAFFRKEQLSKP